MLNASQRRLRPLFLILVLAWLSLHPRTALTAQNATGAAPAAQNATGAAKEPAAPKTEQGNSMGLALKSIFLQHGEQGLELWRLKAGWANMTKQDGVIILEKPVLTYFMSDKTELHVVSDTGNIDQEKHLINFTGNVRATHGTDTVTSKELVYEGAQRTMTFPSGAVFTGEGVHGDADRVIWHMNTRIIEAEGSVDVHLGGPASPAGNAPVKAQEKTAGTKMNPGKDTP